MYNVYELFENKMYDRGPVNRKTYNIQLYLEADTIVTTGKVC